MMPVTGTYAGAVSTTGAPLVVHVVHRFDTGGLENGIVNLINHMPRSEYRHAVLALTEAAPAFCARVRGSDVAFIGLDKSPGHAVALYPRLIELFRSLKPTIVHTRNLAALECQVAAWVARVPVRVHGEHGRDIGDLDGSSRKYQWVRRAYRPFVHHQFALSQDLARYLRDTIGVRPDRMTQVYNGVDSVRFRPAVDAPEPLPDSPIAGSGAWVVGTVGRMQAVKDQTTLARAFVRALELAPALRSRLRLMMVGDGPLREQSLSILESAGAAALAWLPGERADVPEVMRAMNCFVLPSLAEGVSNTILEAMSSGLPVIATDVGGNAELVAHGVTGEVVPAADVEAMARSLLRLATEPERARAMGRAGRAAAEKRFSMNAMVSTYQNTYDRLVAARRVAMRRT